MSLDVYLTVPVHHDAAKARERIYIRHDGRTVEISREEWNERFPDRKPVTVTTTEDGSTVFTYNITHNLSRMAREAGIYEALWRPEENGWSKAGDLIAPLRDGWAELVTFPDRYREFNPENGWGSYEALVEFVAEYLGACIQWPEAEVSVWR